MWYHAARLVLDDKELNEEQKKRIIIKSLTRMADDTISFKRDHLVIEILSFLKAMFSQEVDQLNDQVESLPGHVSDIP